MGRIQLLRKIALSSIAFGLVSTPCVADDGVRAEETSETAWHGADSDMPRPASWLPGWLVRTASTIPSSRYLGDDMGDLPRSSIVIASPAADLDVPGPLTEITVSGYVKGDVILDFDHDLGDEFDYNELTAGTKHTHTRMHARQSRLRVSSKTDTAVGQVRTLIEGDFFANTSSNPFSAPSRDMLLQLRHAWGEWEILPGTIFGAGQYWRNFKSTFSGIPTVDYRGPAGELDKTRNAQVRLTNITGPIEFAVSAEEIALADRANIPDFTARLQYSLPGGSAFMLSGVTRYFRSQPDLLIEQRRLGWGGQIAANIDLGGYAVFTASAMAGEGLGDYLQGGGAGAWQKETGEIRLIPAYGLFGGLRFNLSDTTNLNLGVGYAKTNGKAVQRQVEYDHSVGRTQGLYNRQVTSLHANVMWEPLDQVRFGWEVIWAQRKYWDAGPTPGSVPAQHSASNVRTQFGAWFFF